MSATTRVRVTHEQLQDTLRSGQMLQMSSGPLGKNISYLEDAYGTAIRIQPDGYSFESDNADTSRRLESVLRRLLHSAAKGNPVSFEQIKSWVNGVESDDAVGLTLTGKSIVAKTSRQQQYLELIRSHDLTLAVGPAGTGKTYLAVAAAIEYLKHNLVKRVILTRPVVEAGERLGYLPGGFQEKIHPYLRPLFDAMFDQLAPQAVMDMIEKEIIEMAPLAYMRGRTFNHSFVILDEAQNTTREQMLMFLTRMGYGCRMVVTGDITQVDLPGRTRNGLVEAAERLARVKGVGLVHFNKQDVVRHHLVTQIIEAFDAPRTKTRKAK